MTAVIVTKKIIQEALATEPLTHGSFLTSSDGSFRLQPAIKLKDCVGCAVGNLMRHLVSGEEQAYHVRDVIGLNIKSSPNNCAESTLSETVEWVKEALDRKDPTTALSRAFEGTYRRYYYEGLLPEHDNMMRLEVLFIVDQFFPETFEMNIADLVPLEGVKVV